MKPKSRGFTLIELLVVIAIIGILAATVLAATNSSRQLAQESRALQDMRNIHTAMELMYTQTGVYLHGKGDYCPPVQDTNNEVQITSTNLPQMASQILDPWGNPYWFDEDYYCTAGAQGCNGVVTTGGSPPTNLFSVLVSCGPDDMQGQDPSNGTPNNSPACAYNDDNIVYAFCSS